MLLLRIVAVIGIAIVGVGAGLWYAPEINPVDYFLMERAHPISQAQLNEPLLLASSQPIDLKILYQQKALLIPQDIPLTDCRLMVLAIQDEHKGKASDEFLFKNTQGQFNCPFAALGLIHFEYPPSSPEYDARIDEKFFRSSFIGRPSYSLFKTRFSIVYGSRVDGTKCTYNRFKGYWQREKCHLAYAVDRLFVTETN
jgi:hypothetical protein